MDVFQDESDSSDSDAVELAIVGHTNIRYILNMVKPLTR